MKFARLKKHLLTEPLRPAYIVAGVDAFVRGLAVSHFKNIVVTAAPELNLSIFTESSDGGAIYNACETLPVLSERRLILCTDYKGGDTELLGYLQKPSPSAVLVFVAEKLTENLSKIAAKAELVDCSKLEDEQIAVWVQNQLTETETKIEADAFRLLLDYCGRSMTRIARETEKLGVYCPGGVITAATVEDLVTAETEYKIFELSEAAAMKNAERAVSVLHSLLESGSPPTVLLGAIYSHFRRLLYAAVNPADPELSQKLGVKEYAVKVAAASAKRFGVIRLKQICDEFHRIDFAIKQGEMTDKLGLESYIFGVLTA